MSCISAIRQRLPNRRGSISLNFTDEGWRYRGSLSYFQNGSVGELFLNVCDVDSDSAVQRNAETSAILVSLLLQHGVSVAEILHSIQGPAATALRLLVEAAP